jgi:NADH dehydrogenase
MEPKKIIIIGAGYGGVLTAKKLEKKLKQYPDIEITLIDKNPYHTMLTELHEVAANRVPEDAIRISLSKIFANRKVKLICNTVTSVDFDGHKVYLGDETLAYDYLVIGTGSKPAFYGVKGAEENTLRLWSYEDAVQLKTHILKKFHDASFLPAGPERNKMLTFVTAGCGFTGIEMIGELAEWKNELLDSYGLPKDAAKLYVVDMLPHVLPMFPDNLIHKVVRRLQKIGVTVMTSTNITEVGANFVNLGDKGIIETETVIWAAGVEGSDLAGSVNLEKKGRGRLATNGYLQAENRPEVYVVGDNLFYVPEGAKGPVPQMVENAEHSSHTIASNIVATIENKPLHVYNPQFHGAMVCVGGRYGVAHIGLPGKFFGLSGFFALFVKHLINIVYFLQVAGFNKCWTYMMHEFFHVKNNRSLVGGHFAKASPNFWLVPLRLFLGYSWLMEGLHKLPSILADPNKIFLIPAPVNALSAASEAWVEGAETATQAVVALPVPEFIANMVTFSMELMFYTPEGGFTFMATLFQAFMVLGEIGFGLMLMAGLFTSVASIATLVMGVMIWASGMAPVEMLWYLVAGCATIGGSGSVFGMDYYIYPILKKAWKKIPLVKKYYLYTDN